MIALHFSYSGKSLQEVIWQDPLTSAFNGFAIERYGLPDKRTIPGEFIVIFIDVNKFKVVNDTYGHEFGDQVLVKVTKVLNNTFVRKQDTIVCRQGGDEFLVILPKSQKWFAELAMTKVNRELSPISLSYGIETCESWRELPIAKKRADTLMYAMKQRS